MEAGGSYDVLVVGGGNAALCAALSARLAAAPAFSFSRPPGRPSPFSRR